MSALVAFALYMLAGLLGSLLGLGGGIIVIPVLTLLMGVDMHHAIGASIVAVIATSIASAGGYVRDHLANLRLATFLEVATTTGALAGALVATHVPGRALSIVFACLLIYSAYSMVKGGLAPALAAVEPHPLALRWGLNGAYVDRLQGTLVRYNVAGVPQGFGVMMLAGLVSGLLGIGSGLLKVMGMDLAMKLPIKVSTATSNLMIGVTAASSAWYYYAHGLIDPQLACPIALGVLAGARLGSYVMVKLPSKWLRGMFVPVLLYVAATMIYKGVHGA